MNLARFVYIADPTDSNLNLILHTQYPYVIGKVWAFKTKEEFDSFIKRNDFISIASIDGYRMAVTTYDTLGAKGDLSEVQMIIGGMADFYRTDRIKKNAARFARYKIDFANP